MTTFSDAESDLSSEERNNDYPSPEKAKAKNAMIGEKKKTIKHRDATGNSSSSFGTGSSHIEIESSDNSARRRKNQRDYRAKTLESKLKGKGRSPETGGGAAIDEDEIRDIVDEMREEWQDQD